MVLGVILAFPAKVRHEFWHPRGPGPKAYSIIAKQGPPTSFGIGSPSFWRLFKNSIFFLLHGAIFMIDPYGSKHYWCDGKRWRTLETHFLLAIGPHAVKFPASTNTHVSLPNSLVPGMITLVGRCARSRKKWPVAGSQAAEGLSDPDFPHWLDCVTLGWEGPTRF
jgi:hypothetical protein